MPKKRAASKTGGVRATSATPSRYAAAKRKIRSRGKSTMGRKR